MDLLEVLKEYPEAEAELEERAKKTLQRYGDESNKVSQKFSSAKN